MTPPETIVPPESQGPAPPSVISAATSPEAAVVRPEIVVFERLVGEIERIFDPQSPSRAQLEQPLAAVRSGVEAMAESPEAAEVVAAAIDDLEDVLEALMRAAGWPRAAG
ncbi:MAG: hypothetical protein AAGF11_31240 [Myxococcota bacterium]